MIRNIGALICSCPQPISTLDLRAMPLTLQRLDEPILIDGLTWKEFKQTEQLLDRPGIRLSFLEGVLEIRKMPGRPHETIVSFD